MNRVNVFSSALLTLVVPTAMIATNIRRKSLYEALMQFVAFYVTLPLVAAVAVVILYFYFALLGNYRSAELSAIFLVQSFAGCVTKGLHWTAVSVGSRVAGMLLSARFLISGAACFAVVEDIAFANRDQSTQDEFGMGVVIGLGLLNLLVGFVMLYAALMRLQREPMSP